jgi:hypothetical protein
MPANYDLLIYRGDYFPMTITMRDNNGNPLDLSGFTPAATIRANHSSGTEYAFEATLPGGPGVVSLVLNSDVSALLTPGSYVWDYQLTDANSNVRTYITGDVTVYDEVTR